MKSIGVTDHQSETFVMNLRLERSHVAKPDDCL